MPKAGWCWPMRSPKRTAKRPELLIDVATLTGAARAATGMELPPFFTDDETARRRSHARGATRYTIRSGGCRCGAAMKSAISSSIADLNNMPGLRLAGAITAALFLNRFVTSTKSWVHLDIPAWIDRPKPGRRKGAEASTARALYALLKKRYSPSP